MIPHRPGTNCGRKLRRWDLSWAVVTEAGPPVGDDRQVEGLFPVFGPVVRAYVHPTKSVERQYPFLVNSDRNHQPSVWHARGSDLTTEARLLVGYVIVACVWPQNLMDYGIACIDILSA